MTQDILAALKDAKRLQALDAHSEAVDRLFAIVAAAPDNPAHWIILVESCARCGRIYEVCELAESIAHRLVAPEASLHAVSRWLRNNGFWEAAARICGTVLRQEPKAPKTTHDMLVHIQFSAVSDAECGAYLEAWNQRAIRPLMPKDMPRGLDSDVARPLRLGFVSNDFSADHSLNMAMGAWFSDRSLDDDTYFLYANLNTRSAPHSVFTKGADVFVDTEFLSDSEFATRIREDGIDILIDFVGHMDNSRLLAYASRPSALTVHWIGVGVATGASSVDYLLADPYRTPLENQGLYVEKLALLPKSGICWTYPHRSPAVSSPPHLSGRPFAFGNFSRISKFRPETVALWSRVLNAVPGAIMIFKDHRLSEFNTDRLTAEFGSHGIAPHRLRFLPGTDHLRHLAAYGQVDLMLDSFPEQSGISGLEAAWMGVPMVAMRYAERAGTRVSDWITGNLGLPALVATDADSYVALARDLAEHSDVLVRLRPLLRSRLAGSAICDQDGFRRHVRSALRTMWQRYCAGLPPEGFQVKSSD